GADEHLDLDRRQPGALARRGHRGPHLFGAALRDPDERHPEPDHLLGEQVELAAPRGERDDVERWLAVTRDSAGRLDDVERLGADRSRAAEERDGPAHPAHSTARSTSTARSRNASTGPSA